MSISKRIAELQTSLAKDLKQLRALIENRAAWKDGIEGVREAVAVVEQAHAEMKTVCEGAGALEKELATARAESERWSKLHAELSIVERELRAEADRCREVAEQCNSNIAAARTIARDSHRELLRALGQGT